MEIPRDGYLLNKKMWKFQRLGQKPSVEFPRNVYLWKFITVVPIEMFLKYGFNTLPRADQFI
jgi:hypothetical protein